MRLFSILALIIICLFGNPWDASAQVLVAKNIGATTPLAWGDYDNDGDMDLLQHNGTALRILKNNLVGTTATFVDAGITLANVNPTSVGWIDFNNDGFLDIYYVDAGSLKVWVNQSGTSFLQTTVNLSGESISVIADWGDIDNDGDQDFVGGGLILRNLNNKRFEVSQRLGTNGRTELLDFDNDDDLDFYSEDILYTNKGQGIFELDRTISPNGANSDYEYRDLLFSGTSAAGTKLFADIYDYNTGFAGHVLLWHFSICWGYSNENLLLQYLKIADFDNDGENDVLVRENSTINLYSSSTVTGVGFCENTISTLTVTPGRTEVADFDKDGDLDVFIGSNVFENTTIALNVPPAAPPNLNSLVEEISETESLVTLSWGIATDDMTRDSSLTYNVIIKRGPEVVLTDGIGATGNQALVQRGNAGYKTSMKLYNLPKAKYTWTVQSVDESFKTSVLAPEQSFEIAKGPELVTPLSIPVRYSAAYDDRSDRYLVTYLKNGDLMGLWVDGKTVQPGGAEFKINSVGSASSHIVGYNSAKNEFMVSWLELSGDTKKIYAKNFLSVGENLHTESVVYSTTDTLMVFLGGDKIPVDPVSGKYLIPFFHTRTDLNRPAIKYQGIPVTYYPYALLDVHALKVATNGATLSNEIPKLLQTRNVPSGFVGYQTRYFTIQSAVDFDSKKKMYGLAWNFMGQKKIYYSGCSSCATNVLHTEPINLVVLDENLLVKSENSPGEGGRDLSMLYNPLVDQFILVWSQWKESTTSSGSDEYSFEVYQRIFSTEINGAVEFKKPASLVSKPPNIVNYGSGLPSLSWSKKRNEYLITWTKGIVSPTANSFGALGEGDQFYRRVHPKGHFVDLESKFLMSIPGNESIVRNNTTRGHFLLGWKSSAQNYLSTFNIPKDPKPVVTSISPDKASAGSTVIIRGTGFGNISAIDSVEFGGVKAVVDPVLQDSTKIQVTVPSGLGRSKVPVTVIFDGQESEPSVMFENIDNTSVTSVTPLIGTIGETITIKGINFPTNKADITVMFGDSVATAGEVLSIDALGTEIKVNVPQKAARGIGQTVGVVIQGVPNNYAGGTFRVIRPPVITSVVPEEDFVSRKIIYINGTDFSENPSDLIVKLGSTEVTEKDFSSSNKTKITVRIPGGVKGNLPVSVYADDRLAESPVGYDFVLGSTIKIPPTTRPNEFRFTNKANDKVDFTVEVLNRRAVKELNFRTKGISGSESDWKLQKLPLTNNSNRVDFALSETDFTTDPVGLDAEYVSIDSSGINPDTVRFKVYRNYIDPDPTNVIPDLRFGGSVADYQIVSIPYELQPNNITTVFKDLFNAYGYDRSKWRIFHYETNQSEYSEYLDGLNEIEPGKGYWLISRYPQDIFFEGARTLEVVNGYYEIPLQTGWNQIGNPYNFNLGWSDIMSFNGDAAAIEIESFKTFKNGTFQTATTIERFRGGFVYYNGPGLNLKIPVTQNKGINGGRIEQGERFASDLGDKEWRLAIELKAGDIRNTISSFRYASSR